MRRQKIAGALVLAFLLAVASGCSSAKKAESVDASADLNPKEPLELMLYKYNAGLTKEEQDKFFSGPVAAKFPNVTFKFINGSGNAANSPQNIIASGETPDIIFSSNPSLAALKKLGLPMEISDMIKKSNFDMNKFDPTILDSLKKYSENGENYAIPFSSNFSATFYNKDLFDKFGIPYPKEMSTWDDILELDRKLTRIDGGTQYRGIIPPDVKGLGDQLSIPMVDKATSKANLNTDGWKKIMNILEPFYAIPGILNDQGKIPVGRTAFLNEKTVAMHVDWANGMVGPLEELQQKGGDFPWDMTTFPSHKEALGISRPVDFHLLTVGSTSKNKQLAFEIIKLLVDTQNQTDITKSGRMTALNNNAIKSEFGSDLKTMQGKNLTAAFKSRPSIIIPTDFDLTVTSVINNAGIALGTGQKDTNTALRDANEAADKAIAQELGK